jgi:hypothetical protein
MAKGRRRGDENGVDEKRWKYKGKERGFVEGWSTLQACLRRRKKTDGSWAEIATEANYIRHHGNHLGGALPLYVLPVAAHATSMNPTWEAQLLHFLI